MQSFVVPPDETPEQQQRRMMAAQAQLAGNMPNDLGSGMQSVANALMMRDQARQARFPAAPDGGKASFGTRIANMFGLGGGLR